MQAPWRASLRRDNFLQQPGCTWGCSWGRFSLRVPAHIPTSAHTLGFCPKTRAPAPFSNALTLRPAPRPVQTMEFQAGESPSTTWLLQCMEQIVPGREPGDASETTPEPKFFTQKLTMWRWTAEFKNGLWTLYTKPSSSFVQIWNLFFLALSYRKEICSCAQR